MNKNKIRDKLQQGICNMYRQVTRLSIFTIPITVMAIFTRINTIGRLKEANKALNKKYKNKDKDGFFKLKTGVPTLLAILIILLLSTGLSFASDSTIKTFTANNKELLKYPGADTFPIPPADKKMMFYLQRTPNKNTIVYELNYGSDGRLDSEEPIHVYWIRYTEPGNPKKELNFIQRKFAYGVKVKKESADSWDIRLVSYDKIALQLKKGADGKYNIFTNINNKQNIFTKAFIKIEGGTFWFPNVVYIELSGIDVETGKPVSQKIYL